MSAPIPDTEPTEIVKGFTTQWTRAFNDYPSSAGWVLKYSFRHQSATSQPVFTVVAVASASDHSITLTAAQTALLGAPGVYFWWAWIENAGATERYSVGKGEVKVVEDPTNATTAYDGRSIVKRTLDNIEAMLEGTASREESGASVVYGGVTRQLNFFSRAELIQMHQYFKRLYADEKAAEGLAGGAGSNRGIFTRFSR